MALSVQKASSSTPKWNFHVFLSFRGEDTRKGFTDHLYAALCRKGFKTFRDDEELGRGEVISPTLLKAIEDSLCAIVVLSKNYASSSWCLDELEKILISREELGQQVLPIFYGVDPSDVRHQRESFAEAFTKHEKKFKKDQGKVQKWRDSLTQVANLSGWDSKEWHEAELIENVIEVLWSRVHFKFPFYDDELVGLDSMIDAMDLLLEIGLDDVRFVGIWGMGGIGKTTLARVVYERLVLLQQFEICCFLSNVREVSERCDGQVHLQTKLLSHLKIKGMVIEDTSEGKQKIQNLFCNKRTLLVLDDVSSIGQLENLAKSQSWFRAGSRIIITTRDKHLLVSHRVDKIYKAQTMNEDVSLQLLSKKAFGRDKPMENYLELSKSVVQHAGGLPLALEVLGSFLCGRDIPEWEDTLDNLKKVPNHDIIKILRISYDRLEDHEKRIFLDVACFFKGWFINDIIQILEDDGLKPRIVIKVLIEKSLLVEVDGGGNVSANMHDLVQEMGRSIVFEESPNDAGQRSRLWSFKDINQVLKRNMANEVIQGVVLPFDSYEAHWDPESLFKIFNLRILILSCDLNLSYGLKCLPSALRFLRWDSCPLEAFPHGNQLDELVYLQMQHSKIRQLWDGKYCLENLKFMDLSHSKYLIKTPDFSGVQILERLFLGGCTNLMEIHPSVGQLKYLKEFVLHGCIKVRKLPEFGENMKNLVTLDLEETGIAKLPQSLGFLTSLETLNLKGCKNLVCLPHTIYNLKHLKVLDISCCSKFSILPKNLNEIEALEELDVSGTAISEIPSSIGCLEKLETITFHGCKVPTSNSWILPFPLNRMFQRHCPFPKGIKIPPSIFNLKSLKKLDLSYCNIDDGLIPEDLSALSSLEKLDLAGNKFMSLPATCISNLLKLKILCLDFCPRLQSLPQPSSCLDLIYARECASMEPLSDKQLWCLLAPLIDERGEDARTEVGRELSIKSHRATIPGSEIPSWFENQNNLSLNEKGVCSIIIDIPDQSSCASEWLGIALCHAIDEKLYLNEAKPKGFNLCLWRLETVKASKVRYASLLSTRNQNEKEINSPHLWMMFSQISKKNGLDYNQIRLTFSSFAGRGALHSIKCGWRVIRKEDFEKWSKTMSEGHFQAQDGENGMCSKAKEQGQCSLSAIDGSQTIINESETMSLGASSSCLEEESKSDDSWMQFITDDTRFWF